MTSESASTEITTIIKSRKVDNKDEAGGDDLADEGSLHGGVEALSVQQQQQQQQHQQTTPKAGVGADTTRTTTATAATANNKAATAAAAGGGGVAAHPPSPSSHSALLQEALGVTAKGTCLRHPNCPVLLEEKNRVMSCRICFSEEKSVGIRQRKSFTAVVRQLQTMANVAAATTAPQQQQLLPQNTMNQSYFNNSGSFNASMESLDYNGATSATTDENAMVANQAMNHILQHPQRLESIMKRLAQVQNWTLRQKEKEVLSLQLQIHRLEQQVADLDGQNRDQKQTIKALRRTIQQDLKLIKTMATQKKMELEAEQAASAQRSVAGGASGAASTSSTAAGVAQSPNRGLPPKLVPQLPNPMDSPSTFASEAGGPMTPLLHGDNEDDDEDEQDAPIPRCVPRAQSVAMESEPAAVTSPTKMTTNHHYNQYNSNSNHNNSNNKEDVSPIKRAVAQMKSPDSKRQQPSAAAKFYDAKSPESVNNGISSQNNNKMTPPNGRAFGGRSPPKARRTASSSSPPKSLEAFRKKTKSDSDSLAKMANYRSANMQGGGGSSQPYPYRSVSTRSEIEDIPEDGLLKPSLALPPAGSRDLMMLNVPATDMSASMHRSHYWNESDMSMASNPNMIFASFRGGLLDIPKSPPPARHDHNGGERPQRQKLTLDPSQLKALRMPPSRSNSTDEFAGLNVAALRAGGRRPGPPLDLGTSSHTATSAQTETSNSGSVAPGGGDKEIPLDVLAQKLSQLPLSSRRLEGQSPEQFFKETATLDPKAPSLAPPLLTSQVSSGSTSSVSPSSSKSINARKPQRTKSSDSPGLMSALGTPSLLGPDEYEKETEEDTDLHLESPVAATTATVSPVSTKNKKPESAPSAPNQSPVSQGEQVESNHPSAPASHPSDKPDEKFVFTVTGASCHDKYGDAGSYTGQILVTEGLPHGQGTMKYETGRVYSGEWVRGQWHGKGSLLNNNGDRYEGEFCLDARHGKGVYTWDNGDVYTGSFMADKRHGEGKFSFHNGNVYEGEFVDGMFEGYGRYEFAGGYYEGEWKEGRYDGSGELSYESGAKYTGDFKNSVAHGFGLEVSPNGSRRRGVWDNGVPVESFE